MGNISMPQITVVVLVLTTIPASRTSTPLTSPATLSSGRRKNAAANERAHQAFERLAQEHPGEPLYLVHLGSTWLIKARDAWMPWTKLRQRLSRAGVDR